MALARLQLFRRLHRSCQYSQLPSIPRSYQSYISAGTEGISYRSIMTCSCTIRSILGHNESESASCHSFQVSELTTHSVGVRLMSTDATRMRGGPQQVSMKVNLLSPGIIYEPYEPREPISFWRRWFTLSGWRRTKEDLILEMKSAYAISRLRKVGYSKKTFYQQAIRLYKEMNTLLANGDTKSLRKLTTEKMYSTLKNEIKRRGSIWSHAYWELVEPVVSIRTLRARMIAMDKDNLDKSFIQLTIEFVTKQKFEAYDSKGAVVSGDKAKEVLVREIWVFERSLFHRGADWRLCAKITPKAAPS